MSDRDTKASSVPEEQRSAELEAEAERLRRRVEELEARPGRRRTWRRIAAALMVAFAVIAFAVAVPGAWARRTLFDTDRYVALVEPLPRDPDVQEYLTRTVTTAVFDALSIEERLTEALSERAPRIAFLAGPITNGVRGFVQDRAGDVVSSEAFATYWAEANRIVHEQLVAAIRGEEGVLTTQQGQVVLDLLPIVNEVLRRIGGVASELIGRDLSLPEVTPDQLSDDVIPRLEAALDRDLPDGFGRIVVYDGNEVESVQRAFALFERGVFLAVLAFVLFSAGALWASTSKRRTLLQLVTALLVVLVIERRFAIAAADQLVLEAREENRAAADAIVDRVLGSILSYTGWILAVALVVALVALLTGPYPWAIRLRTWVTDVGAAVAGAGRSGAAPKAAIWIAERRDALMLGGAALGVVVLLFGDLSVAGAAIVVLILAVYAFVVHRVAASVRSEASVTVPEPR
jgi:hypothetical protein